MTTAIARFDRQDNDRNSMLTSYFNLSKLITENNFYAMHTSSFFANKCNYCRCCFFSRSPTLSSSDELFCSVSVSVAHGRW